MKNLRSALLVTSLVAGCGGDASSVSSGMPDLAVGGTTSPDLAHAPGVDLAGRDFAGAPAPDLLPAPSDGAPAPSDGPSMSSGPYLFPAVWTIIMENHDRNQILTSTDATYIQTLASTYAQAASYTTLGSPSLPNYIEMTCGCSSAHQLVGSLDTPANLLLIAINNLFGETSLGGQLQTAGVSWRAYAADSATGSTLGNCAPSNTGEYVSRHMPFIYFKDVFGTGTNAGPICTSRVRVFGDPVGKTGDFYSDLAAGTYAYQWITPDLIENMHDGTIADGNLFLSRVVPEIQKSAAYQAGGVIFITWDEGSSTSNQALFIAVSKRAKMGYQSPTAFGHPNFLATIEDIYKLDRLGTAVGVPNMMELFTP
jgi:acid phosphatase